ncbi:glycoside hydrolase family 16 protein [bacterium]|nr:glycoside hydrolase family 16 protein [bacterium]
MIPSARGLLRGAALLFAVGALAACESGGENADALADVQSIDVPVADTTNTVNVNTESPTLTVLDTFQVNDGDLLTLVWSDEFNGDQLDPETWFFATGDGAEQGLPSGWGNNELQWYQPDNARLEDGKLIIEAKREIVVADNAAGDETTFGFTSARLNTQNRINVQYGRIEARIKLPAGQGIWPAFWMFPQSDTYGGFSASGEIDIMEAVNLGGTPGPGGAGGGNNIFGTIHFGGEFPNNQSASVQMQAPEDVTADFHNYAVEWDEFEIRWYFDGQLYAVQNSWSSTGGAFPAPFDHPFYILLNVAVGGNFPGPPNAATPLPATMEVDWVRVFTGEDAGAPFMPADSGVIPDDVIYASDPSEMVDLVFGEDYTGFEPFGSGSTFDNNVTGDPDFSPAFGVTTGDGYGAQVGQFAIVGFDAGFATAYDSLVFKAKNLNNNLIRVKLLDSDPYVDIDLATSSFSTDLGNGWYQVVLPVAQLSNAATATGVLFETDNTAPASFTFLLTDLGFSSGATMAAGQIPDDVIYASDPIEMVDLVFGVDYTGFEPFGSGSTFDNNVTGDADFSPAFGVTTGNGYGAQVGQFAIVGFDAGFAAQYESLVFKAKNLNNDLIRVKLLDSDPYVDINLTTSNLSTDLGNGWYQVVLPVAQLSNAATATGLLFETDNTAPASFTFLLTDFGFSGTAGGGMGGGGMGGGAMGAELAQNGGLETGDFTGWMIFANGGTATVTNTDPSSGSFSANATVVAPASGAPAPPILKQESVGVGVVGTNEQITISFDLKGTVANGAFVNAEFFSERASGADMQLLESINAPNAGWTSYGPYTVTTSDDVTRGITVQFVVICGAVAGCMADVDIDNVSITQAAP